jgi:hypothetical protein
MLCILNIVKTYQSKKKKRRKEKGKKTAFITRKKVQWLSIRGTAN